MQPVQLGHVAGSDGATLVAVHGGLLAGRLTFGPVLADWAQRFRVLVPDRRGFELSPGVGGTLADSTAIRPDAERLRAAGYSHRDDPDSNDTDPHVVALRRADGRRLAHAHVVTHGGTWWCEHLAFRDLLRDDPDLRRRYEEHKRALAGRLQSDREAYTDAKTGLVTAALHERRVGR